MNRFRCTLTAQCLAASLFLLGPLSAAPSHPVAPPVSEAGEDETTLPADRLETKLGTLAIEADPGEDSVFWATLDGERLVKLEGDRATLAAHLGQRSRDVVLLEIGSGGIACPLMYRVVELRPKQPPVVSDEFGSCLEMADFAFQGTKVVVRMPAYTPHPDLLSEAEVRRREKTDLVYTWEHGTIRERAVVRK